ncbi:MAG: alpha-amylase [Chlorobiaceae bacterium]|nr:alpha-amylase [Chlorobiaceae bacterium]
MTPDVTQFPDSRVEKRLRDIDFKALVENRKFHPSPASWADEILYFLFLDRFSDGREFGGFGDSDGVPLESLANVRSTPLFDPSGDTGSAERASWFEAGRGWCGGTIAGMKSKLGYLSRLGISAIWVSPVFRQVTGSSDYHGYGIQNFLDVDPHFGTREELRDFVKAAHASGIRVILDIIINHAGDVFAYQGNERYYYHEGRQWPVDGFRLSGGEKGSLPFSGPPASSEKGAWPEGAVWPEELQNPETWTRKGEIRGWDTFPEFLEGDFCTLKDINLGDAPREPGALLDIERRVAGFVPSRALRDLTDIYRFWIAYADIDGYRLDTVKHMEPGAVRYFVTGIHEFAESVGKENFAIIGEITGGRANAMTILDATGLDAALGIDDIPDKLEFLVKGQRSPGNPETADQEGYFDLFRNNILDNRRSHQWYSRQIVTMLDDHDQVGVRHKFRFCGDSARSASLLRPALGLNLTSAGIPCIYYGTEQAFNGADNRHGDDSWSDVFLRECMFGGPFGSYQSSGRHFFNEGHEVYRFISDVAGLCRRHIALRRGRQFLRQVSESGLDWEFCYPQPVNGELHWVIAWSRIFDRSEYLCAINTDTERDLEVWAVVDSSIHPSPGMMECIYSTDPQQIGQTSPVSPARGAALRVRVPAAGFVVYR